MDSNTSTLDKLKAMYGPHDQRLPFRHIDDLEALAQQIDELKYKGETLKVALFWGPHPDTLRTSPGKADQRTLRAVNSLFEGIIPTDTTIILADYHGRVNGIENESYLKSIGLFIEELNANNGANSIRAISLDGLYEMFNIKNQVLPSVPNVSPEVMEKLQVSSANHATRADAQTYIDMRRREFPAVDVILDITGKSGLLIAITDPETMEVFDGLINRVAIIRGENKSGAKKSNTPPWIPHSGITRVQIDSTSVHQIETNVLERGVSHAK